MFLEPFHEVHHGFKVLFPKSEPLWSWRYKLVPHLVPGHIGQHKLAGQFFTGREEVMNLAGICPVLALDNLIALHSVTTICVGPEIFKRNYL